MKSVINFYYVPFNDGENKLIEDIEAFLSRTSADAVENEFCTYLGTIDDFQFIKNDTELTIKIISGQLEAPLYNANYLSVINWNGVVATSPTSRIQKTYYYFIKSIRSLAEDTLELTLKMDTLNTLGVDLIDSNNWLDATLVEREHRDRYFDGDDLPHNTTTNAYAKRVDEIPEGIQFPFYKEAKNICRDILDSKFYLVYRSSFVYGKTDQDQSDNAVKCFLVAEKGKHIPIYNYAGNARDINFLSGDFDIYDTGDIIVFDIEDNPDLWYELRHTTDGVTYYNGTNMKFARENNLKGYVGIYIQNASTEVYRIFSVLFTGSETLTTFTDFHAGGAYNGKTHVDDPATSSSSAYQSETHRRSTSRSTDRHEVIFHKARIGYKKALGSNPGTTIPTDLQSWSAWKSAKSSWTKKVYAEGIGIQDMMTIDQVNRTDSRLIKIIELPYAPNAPVANGSGANTHYTFGSNWSTSEDYDEDNMDMVNAFQLVGDIEPDFTHNLSSKYSIYGVQIIGTSATYLKPWSANYETKLLHSDYTKHMFVYDNFSMELKEEMLWRTNFWEDAQFAPSYNYLSFDIQFTASSNLTSGNMFQLHCPYEGDDIAEDFYKSEDIYPLTLIAVRNNELNLYNASYLNYIRAGYNYDIKAKSIQQKMGFLSAEQQHTNALIGVVNAGASGSATGAVHALTGLYGAFYNYNVAIKQVAYQQALAQNQIDKTLAQTAIQGTSVAGADNLSLFNKYSGNKLLHVEMSILPVYKEKVAQLFHFFGYATQKYKIPNFTGRCFFNYVKCQPVLKDLPKSIAFKNSALMPYRYYGFSEKIFKDAISRFNDGVFIIHKFAPNEVIGNIANTWNISMDKENWENFILTELEE